MEIQKPSIVKTRKQIADEYGIHPKTLSRWLNKFENQVTNGLITPLEQNKIYKQFGNPKNIH